jgi:cyclin-dependent kinase 7
LYGPSTDIWSVGCIFGELFLRDYLFAGNGQIDQLSKIFSVRGTPTKENWPNVTKLPDYLEFSQMKPADLSKIFPMMSSQGLDLLDQCLKLDPNQRPTA